MDWCCQCLRDARLQFRADEFIGIQAEHPVVLAGFNGKLFLRTKSHPGLFNHPGSVGDGQGLRAVSATRIDDDDFISKSSAFQRFCQLRGRIQGDDGDRKRLAWCGHL